MFCKNCGREYSGKFCPNCGKAADENTDKKLDIQKNYDDINSANTSDLIKQSVWTQKNKYQKISIILFYIILIFIILMCVESITNRIENIIFGIKYLDKNIKEIIVEYVFNIWLIFSIAIIMLTIFALINIIKYQKNIESFNLQLILSAVIFMVVTTVLELAKTIFVIMRSGQIFDIDNITMIRLLVIIFVLAFVTPTAYLCYKKSLTIKMNNN